MHTFKDPTGKVLPQGSRQVFNYGGDGSRPVIEKGDGSYLTPGNPKDAKWMADRIPEGPRVLAWLRKRRSAIALEIQPLD